MVKDAVIFTTTFYNNSEESIVRKKLTLEFAREVIEADYLLVILEGGTDDQKYIDQLKSLGAQVYPETKKGLGPSRRESLHYAYRLAVEKNISHLGWSEPEKVGYVKSIDLLVRELEDKQARLIVPQRKEMSTYPVAQGHSETLGNQLHTDQGYLDMNGNPLDQFFGPHLWKRQMSPYFQIFSEPEVAEILAEMRISDLQQRYKVELTEEQRAFERKKAEMDLLRSDHMMHMPTCLMILRGERVISLEVDYTHPPEQTKIETEYQAHWNAKRVLQLNALAEQFKLVRVLHESGIWNEKLERTLKDAH